VMQAIETEGLRVIGAHDILHDLLLPAGSLTPHHVPTARHLADITLGRQAAALLGSLDIGQAVIVQQGRIVGVEGAEGTDSLIARCAPWTREGKAGILIKCAKPQQDTRADLPALGPETVAQAAAAGLVGIAGEAEKTLLLDPAAMATAAEQAGMFVYGF
jgi:UDP-2,3-diacylglucosamine hydrolase